MRLNFSRSAAWATAAVLSLGLTGVALAGDGTAALKHLPGDASIVVHFNTQRIQQSALFKELWGTFKQTPDISAGLQMIKSELGLDIEKELQGLTLVLPNGFDTNKSDEMVLFAEGKFNEGAIKTALTKAGQATEQKHAGKSYFGGPDGAGFSFVQGGLLAGNGPIFKKAMEASSGKANLTTDKNVGALLKGTETTKDFWMVATLPPEMRKQLQTADPNAGKIEALTSSLDLASGASLRLRLRMVDAGSAKAMATQLSGELSKLKAEPMINQLGFGAVINKAQIANSGKDVSLSMDLDAAEVQRIRMMVGMMTAAMKAAQGGGMGAPGMGAPGMGAPGMMPPPGSPLMVPPAK